MTAPKTPTPEAARAEAPRTRREADRLRRCAVTGETRDPAALLRFALDGEGRVFPDPAGAAPGRGVWLTPTRETVALAVKRNAFAKSVKGPAKPEADLPDRAEAALVARCLDRLSMARKAGAVTLGFDQVDALLRKTRPAWRIEASDGADDGRMKLSRVAFAVWTDEADGEPPVCGAFSAAELGVALQRDRVIHAAVSAGRLAQLWGADLARLAGFRPLRPASWPPDPWRSGA